MNGMDDALPDTGLLRAMLARRGCAAGPRHPELTRAAMEAEPVRHRSMVLPVDMSPNRAGQVQSEVFLAQPPSSSSWVASSFVGPIPSTPVP